MNKIAKLIYREHGKILLEEITAPVDVIDQMISKHAGLMISPDAGKSWKSLGWGDWDYFQIVGTFTPPKPKVSYRKVQQTPAAAPEQTLGSILRKAEAKLEERRKSSESRWLSENLPEEYSRKFNFPMTCKFSGLSLGKFFPSAGLAVATPYVQNFKEAAFLHPIFSLSLPTILYRAEACWQLEKTGTSNFPTLHKQLLFLAMLHASGCIKQDIPGLPHPKLVETHFMRVFEMLTWKHETASDRVHFPKLHVWQGADKEDSTNIFKQIPVWLDFCEIAKEEYENVSRERQKVAKAKARELALKSIRRSMYADVSLRRLWNWISAQVPQIVLENNPDFEMLFFVEENKIHAWTDEDITALEDTYIKYCDLGNSVSFECGKRLNQIKEWRRIYHDTFEIVTDPSAFAAFKDTPAPVEKDFSTRAAFLVATARWKLGNTKSDSSEEI